MFCCSSVLKHATPDGHAADRQLLGGPQEAVDCICTHGTANGNVDCYNGQFNSNPETESVPCVPRVYLFCLSCAHNSHHGVV